MPTESAPRPRCPSCDSATRGLYSRHGASGIFVRRPLWECATCARVTPANLNELLATLRDGHIEDDAMDDLPTFGGEPIDVRPRDEIWSWDATHKLVGSGRDLKIVKR